MSSGYFIWCGFIVMIFRQSVAREMLHIYIDNLLCQGCEHGSNPGILAASNFKSPDTQMHVSVCSDTSKARRRYVTVQCQPISPNHSRVIRLMTGRPETAKSVEYKDRCLGPERKPWYEW